MTATAEQTTTPGKNIAEKIREFPLGSAAAVALSVGTLTESFNVGLLFFGAPIVSGAIALTGAINAMDKKRSGLSRCFNAAAAVVGAVGAIAPFVIAGPAALGALFISAATMGVAGGFNLAAYFLRDKKLPFKVSVEKTTEPEKPKAPAPTATP
ncbi:MAG: hypothetical protein ACAH80_01470 [Alphaproteobacteria bacterium]